MAAVMPSKQWPPRALSCTSLTGWALKRQQASLRWVSSTMLGPRSLLGLPLHWPQLGSAMPFWRPFSQAWLLRWWSLQYLGGCCIYAAAHVPTKCQGPMPPASALSFLSHSAIPQQSGSSPGAVPLLQTFITAYLELIMLGQLKKGQSVLIHAGASGVGKAPMMCGIPV